MMDISQGIQKRDIAKINALVQEYQNIKRTSIGKLKEQDIADFVFNEALIYHNYSLKR